MALEQSHGKLRPTLPRSGDLTAVRSERNPTEGRGPGGRFAPGNRLSVGAGDKAAVRKLLGRRPTEGEVAVVARDAMRLFNGAVRDLPSDGPTVRSLASLYARHAAVSAYFNVKADEAGLETDAGQAMLETALRHGQRVERLAVTMLDVATRLAKASGSESTDLAALERDAEAETERRRRAERAAINGGAA